jgi:uncharacterized membrane protein
MTSLLIATATALHALATVVFIGYYLLLSLFFLPVLAKPETGGSAALGEVSRRSRWWQYASLLVFIITGFYLMLVDTSYLGIGNFGNPWAILMLLKHFVVLLMIGLGFWFNAAKRVGHDLRSYPNDAARIARYRRFVTIMTICGVLVLVLTAFAQVV